MTTHRIAILDGLRTPFAKSAGALRDIGADDLAASLVSELIDRTGVDGTAVDEVIFGNVAQPTHAANIARVIALKAGLPNDVIAHTVHRNCASGMQAITAGALQIMSGRADVVIAGGTESMSQIPLLFGDDMTKMFIRLMRARTLRQRAAVLLGFRPSHLKPIIALQLGLTDPICGLNMGQTAEVLARDFGIDRETQDAFALQSHLRALAAAERLADEILPVTGPPRYDHMTCGDDGPREGQSMAQLAKLRPYFDRAAGTVTVGNACPVTDGAAAVILCSERRARSMGIEPLGFLGSWEYAALDGKRMGLGPVHAAAKLIDRTGCRLDDFDLVEINEAFAAQVLANVRAFDSRDYAKQHLNRSTALGSIGPDRLNVNGGAIALGHPVGATGTRLVVTLLKEMKRRGAERGLATLCVGGGQGAALSLEAA